MEGEKLLEKFQHAENNFENSKHAVEKSNEVQREFEKGGESKYEINTNLPLAGRVIWSPMCTTFLHHSYHWSARPGELDEAELSTFRHNFFAFFFF